MELKNLQTIHQSYIEALPNSDKVYVQGSDQSIQVGMRKIRQTDTPMAKGESIPNPDFYVYDTSGFYTDPQVNIDFYQGLPTVRSEWIEARQDTEQLSDFTSHYSLQQQADEKKQKVQFPHIKKPRRALKGKNVTQMHYAKQGIITPEMEYIAIRENQQLEKMQDEQVTKKHKGQNFNASIPAKITPEFVRDEVAKGVQSFLLISIILK